MKKSVLILLLTIFLTSNILAVDYAKNFIDEINKDPNGVVNNWFLYSSTWEETLTENQRVDAWNSLNAVQQKKLWQTFSTGEKALFFRDINEKDISKMWNWMSENKWTTADDRKYIFTRYNDYDPAMRDILWKNLDKKHRNELWFSKDNSLEKQGYFIDDNTRNQLFKSLASKEEKQEMINQILTSEQNLEKLKRRGIEVNNVKIQIDLSKINLEDLEFKNIKTGLTLSYGKESFIRLDELNPYLNKITLGKDGTITNDYEGGLKINYNTGSVDYLGYLLNKENDYYSMNQENINVIETGLGEIDVLKKVNEKNQEYLGLNLRAGAQIKIGNNVFKQFYGINSEYEDYKPENGKDEDAALRIFETNSPLYGMDKTLYLQNTIVSVYEDEKHLGEVYTSRRQPIKFTYSKQIVFNPFDSSFDPAYDSSKEPQIEINPKESGEIDVKIVGDYYMGFIAKKGVNIDKLYVNGEGKEKYGLGQYIYVRNGELGTSIEQGETHISGNTKNADVSVNRLVNGKDNNPNNELTIEKREQSSLIYTKDKTVTLSTHIWEDSERLIDIAAHISQVQEKITSSPENIPQQDEITRTTDLKQRAEEIKAELKKSQTTEESKLIPFPDDVSNPPQKIEQTSTTEKTQKQEYTGGAMSAKEMLKIIEYIDPNAFKAQ